jgi:capsular exopolysaccharide synthesis family protein
MSNDQFPSTQVRQFPKLLPAVPPLGVNLPDSEAHHGLDLKEYLRIIVKYRLVVLIALVTCLTLAALYAFLATPKYTAESKIRISTYEPILSAARIEDMLQEKSKESNYLETQIQEMKSYTLADAVLKDPTLKAFFEGRRGKGFLSIFRSGSKGEDNEQEDSQDNTYSVPFALIKGYIDTIEIKPVRRTSLVAVSATSENPQIAALIANLHASTYIDWVRSSRIDQQARGLTFLRSQADELRQKVSDLEREAADYAESNSIVAVNKDENITAQKMSQLNKLLTDASAAKIQAENLYKEAEAGLNNPSAGFDDSSTQAMRTQLAQLQGEYEQLSAKFQPGYPKMMQLKAQIDGLKTSIQSQRRQIVAGMKAKMLSAAAEEKKLQEELDQQKSLAFELSKRQVQYNVLNREIATSRELLENVLKQIKETSLAVESNSSNVSVVDKAVVPRSPSYPKKFIILLLGLGIGIGAGLILALLLNYLDSTVRTPDDVVSILKTASLGVVPSFDIEGVGVKPSAPLSPALAGASNESLGIGDPDNRLPQLSEQLPVVFLQDPRSLAAEAYRTIRTGILLSQAGEPPRTLLVTSAQPSEGKTTSSVNLAVSLASNGSRVILIDADLRRPSLHKGLGLPTQGPGLSEVITGQTSLDSVIRHDVMKRLSVITAGAIPPNPAELLGSAEMLDLVRGLTQMYDFVVIDSPPILAVTDSVVLSRYVDGVVMVVRGATTPRRVVQDAKNRLLHVGARVLGIVLNDVNIRGGDYYYYNRYYYSYYAEDTKREAV